MGEQEAISAAREGECLLLLETGEKESSARLVLKQAATEGGFAILAEEKADIGRETFTELLAGYLRELLLHEGGEPLPGETLAEEAEPLPGEALTEKAKQLYAALCTAENAEAAVSLGEQEVRISAKLFAEMTTGLRNRLVELAGYAMGSAHGSGADAICLLGEAENLPGLEEGLKAAFPDCRLPGREAQALPCSVGIAIDRDETYGEKRISHILRKGSPLPAAGRRRYFPAADAHKRLRFELYRTAEDTPEAGTDAGERRYLGSMTYDLPEAANRYTPVYCAMEADGGDAVRVTVSTEGQEEKAQRFLLDPASPGAEEE